MANPPKSPLPQPNFPWVATGLQPTQPFAQYMAQLDATVRALAAEVTELQSRIGGGK
jgi:hypothetical protein